MAKANRRGNTRSQVWADTIATIEVPDPYSPGGRAVLTITGPIGDLGSTGMFLKTEESVPIPAKAEITIDFNPERPMTLYLTARGETVRSDPGGVGIRFTQINIQRLQQCILERMKK